MSAQEAVNNPVDVREADLLSTLSYRKVDRESRGGSRNARALKAVAESLVAPLGAWNSSICGDELIWQIMAETSRQSTHNAGERRRVSPGGNCSVPCTPSGSLSETQ